MWPGQSPPTGLAKECRDSDPAVPSGSAPAPSREGWRRLLRRSGDTRLAGGHSPGPEGKAPGLHRALASVPSAPHTHSSDPQAQIPGPSPSRYPRAHGTSCLCPERRLGTCSHPGGRAGSRLGRPGQRRVRVPGHGESRSCALKRERTYLCLQMIHTTVQLKLTQHCKAINYPPMRKMVFWNSLAFSMIQ